MAIEVGEKDKPVPPTDTGVRRRGLLNLGTLWAAFTGASVVAALGGSSAQGATGDQYVPIAEKGAPSGVAALDSGAKILASQLPDLTATFATPATVASAVITGIETSTYIPTAIAPGSLLDASRTIVVGDSLTRGADSETIQAFRGSWFTHLNHASDGLVRLTKNAAHGGYNSGQLRALFDSEVLALNPTLVGFMCGRNDTPNTSNHPQPLMEFITEAVAKCRARGIGVFLVNTVPQGNAALAVPTPVVVERMTTGGTVPARVHRYKVTAGNGSTGAKPTGETTPSAEVSVTTTSGRSINKLSWPHVLGANWYRVYYETTVGSGVYGLLATVAPGASTAGTTSHHYFHQSVIAPGAAAPAINTTAGAAAYELNRARINAWLSSYAAKQGIPLVDTYSLLVDPATGMHAPGMTWDGTHPTGKASALIGEAVWAVLKPLVKPAPVIITTSQADPVNIVDDPLLQMGTAALPTGWTKTTVPSTSADAANHVTAREARTGFKGNALRQTLSVAGEGELKSANITTGFTVGDKILMSVQAELGLAAGGAHACIAVRKQDNLPLGEFRFLEVDRSPHTLSVEFTVPAATTSMHWYDFINGQGFTAIGQLTLYNLTTESYLAV